MHDGEQMNLIKLTFSGGKSMYEIVEEEYQQFLYDIEVEGSLVFGRYIDESNYEDEYSHNDIEQAQGLFMEKVRKYLHENYPSKYVVSDSYCVFVMTPERARESNISEYFVTMPSSALIHIQKIAPGPPETIAVAIPAILPVPIVPAIAVATA